MSKLLQEPSRRRGGLLIIIAGAIILIVIMVFLFPRVVSLVKLKNTEKHLRAEVEQLRRENDELKKRVEGLRNNPAVIENEARGIGLVREKEQVIVVPPSR